MKCLNITAKCLQLWDALYLPPGLPPSCPTNSCIFHICCAYVWIYLRAIRQRINCNTCPARPTRLTCHTCHFWHICLAAYAFVPCAAAFCCINPSCIKQKEATLNANRPKSRSFSNFLFRTMNRNIPGITLPNNKIPERGGQGFAAHFMVFFLFNFYYSTSEWDSSWSWGPDSGPRAFQLRVPA